VIGRFLSVDPVGPLSDPVRHFGRYHYANNNPYRFTDPDGREPKHKPSACTGTHIPTGDCGAFPGNQGVLGGNPRSGGSEADEIRATRASIISRAGETYVEASKVASQTGLEMAAGGAIGKLLRRILGAARVTTVSPKIEGQLPKRGWSRASIDDAISNPVRTVSTRDTRHMPGGGRNNDPATAYYSRDGGYVVRNDRTGDVVQVSNRMDPNWRAPWD
jgi:hypothetical protein